MWFLIAVWCVWVGKESRFQYVCVCVCVSGDSTHSEDRFQCMCVCVCVCVIRGGRYPQSRLVLVGPTLGGSILWEREHIAGVGNRQRVTRGVKCHTKPLRFQSELRTSSRTHEKRSQWSFSRNLLSLTQTSAGKTQEGGVLTESSRANLVCAGLQNLRTRRTALSLLGRVGKRENFGVRVDVDVAVTLQEMLHL